MNFYVAQAIRAGEEVLYDYGERDVATVAANMWLDKT